MLFMRRLMSGAARCDPGLVRGYGHRLRPVLHFWTDIILHRSSRWWETASGFNISLHDGWFLAHRFLCKSCAGLLSLPETPTALLLRLEDGRSAWHEELDADADPSGVLLEHSSDKTLCCLQQCGGR